MHQNAISLGRCFEGFCCWDLPMIEPKKSKMFILCRQMFEFDPDTVGYFMNCMYMIYDVHTTMFITCSNMYTLT